MVNRIANQWSEHEFYTQSVVLGLDIGLEGIGVCLRKGREIVYLKTLQFDLPDSDVLASRRQKRAWRHCRKNRRTRLHRLAKLFRRHGLPVPEKDVLAKTDPFILRHRALTTGLASRHALAVAIRHCLLRRGFDFHANSAGDFPWGDGNSLKEAIAWMENTHLTGDLAKDLEELMPSLVGSKRDAEDPDTAWAKEREQFRETLARRVQESADESIDNFLAVYKSERGERTRKKIRGHNFHRSAVEKHLRSLIDRHRHLIDDPNGFVEALFVKPDRNDPPHLQRRCKEKAIFHFHRKTPREMEALWEKKTRECPLAPQLGLTLGKVADNDDPDVRRWKLLEFLAFRRIEVTLVEGKGAQKKERRVSVRPSSALVKKFTEAVGCRVPKWTEAKAELLADLSVQHPGVKVVPVPSNREPRNKDYFDQLRDLVCPTPANLRGKAGISSNAARWLFDQATSSGTCFGSAGILERLNQVEGKDRKKGLFEIRKAVAAAGPLYPQVRFLLGERAKSGPLAGQYAVRGMLQKIFEDHADELGGATRPDYVVIECVRDAPRNQGQARRIQEEQKARRARRDKEFKDRGFEDNGVASKRRRIALHAQQRGRCPFTGQELPANPYDPSLELEHLYPQEMGGLSTDSNLVLTFRWVNALKGKRTPKEFAADLGNPEILSWDEMLRVVAEFKWSRRTSDGQPEGKYDLFTFDVSSGAFPDFGNTTRVAQLARQLVEETRYWLGIGNDAEKTRRRIGTPSGWLAAQARRCWAMDAEGNPLRKNRDEPQHHLVDAYVLAHIPPADGLNHARYGGIFTSEWETVSAPGQVTSRRAVTRVLPGLCPNFGRDVLPLLGHDPDELPIYKHRPRKWASSMGDETFWRVDLTTGETYQREPLRRSGDVEDVIRALERSRIPADLIPAKSVIERWLNRDGQDETPLTLVDGTPVKNVWKAGKKQSLKSPLGWSGVLLRDGKRDAEVAKAFRILDTKSEALEIWLGWTGKKWELIKRRQPDSVALKQLLRFAGPWKGQPAPAWMQKDPTRPETHKTLEEIVCGAVLPGVRSKLAEIRRGDVRRMEILGGGEVKPGKGGRSSWWSVSAVLADLRVKFLPVLALPREWGISDPKYIGDPRTLLSLCAPNLGTSDLVAIAEATGLSAPVSSDDPPPHSRGRRRARTEGPPGQTDFGFA